VKTAALYTVFVKTTRSKTGASVEENPHIVSMATSTMTVRLGAPSHGKFLSTKAVRGHRSVANKMVTRAIFDKKKVRM
jgi:hypothetical protein